MQRRSLVLILWLLLAGCQRQAESPSARQEGRSVDIGDTRLYVVERGRGYPLILLHGGPGLDHHIFGDYLDALGGHYRLILVDQRAHGLSGRPPRETWSVPQYAKDVGLLARAMGLREYAVLGHSFGALVALQHAVDFPKEAAQTILSSGVPSHRFAGPHVERELAKLEPKELRQKLRMARAHPLRTPDDMAWHFLSFLPFGFADPLDARIAEYEKRIKGIVYSPEPTLQFSYEEARLVNLEDRLKDISHPVLVLAGRHDRFCSVEAAELMAAKIPNAVLAVFERSGHMSFVEENERYVNAVDAFISARKGAEPDGPANGSQPFSSDTNSMSPAAGSRR